MALSRKYIFSKTIPFSYYLFFRPPSVGGPEINATKGKEIPPDELREQRLNIMHFYRVTPSSNLKEAACRVFSHGVKVAMLVSQTTPIGTELFFCVNTFFCSVKLNGC